MNPSSPEPFPVEMMTPEMLAYVRAAQPQNNRVDIRVMGRTPEACPYCFGAGELDFITKNSYGIQLDLRIFPCPVCGKSRQLEKAWKICGLRENERTWTVDFIQNMQGKEIAHSVASGLASRIGDACGMVIFFGGYGTGKTGLLKALVAAATRSLRPARYLHTEAMLGQIRSTYHNDSPESEASLLAEFSGLPVLALDELDRVSTSSWALSQLMTILDRRYEARTEMLTLLATNAHIDQLPEHFGYLHSRLKDGQRVPLAGVDLRGRGV